MAVMTERVCFTLCDNCIPGRVDWNKLILYYEGDLTSFEVKLEEILTLRRFYTCYNVVPILCIFLF